MTSAALSLMAAEITRKVVMQKFQAQAVCSEMNLTEIEKQRTDNGELKMSLCFHGTTISFPSMYPHLSPSFLCKDATLTQLTRTSLLIIIQHVLFKLNQHDESSPGRAHRCTGGLHPAACLESRFRYAPLCSAQLFITSQLLLFMPRITGPT